MTAETDMAAVLCNNKWQSFIYTYSYILGMIQENVPGGTLGGGGGGGAAVAIHTKVHAHVSLAGVLM